ncbi:hypothetical protein DM01DRAFT_1331185 [Hesseltinella vesiculosa]|uniref:PH domain-containing protein n=1 Tax=Hesseltinella vesiculosa TaxID=101127 RepID=A0A1X2GYD8_9FUNG|nr:hypothetical protein DM01DRAFT_1331185 [Hesseltinella vesiculosa]
MFPDNNESGIIDTMVFIPTSSSPSLNSDTTKPDLATSPNLLSRTLMTNDIRQSAPTSLRHSMVSQYSSSNTSASNSTHRHSFASSLDVPSDPDDAQSRRWSAESCSWEHVLSQGSTPTSSASLQPSSRYLLSGAVSSTHRRHQELQRFIPTASNVLPLTTHPLQERRIKSLSDPFVDNTMPLLVLAPRPAPLPPSVSSSISGGCNKSNRLSMLSTSTQNTYFATDPTSPTLSFDQHDPWCVCVKAALDNALCHNWLYRYEPPSFALARSWKRRMVVLVDRSVYVFKNNKPTCPIRDHFLLTDDTLIFVTEAFKKGCVIEMRKPLCRWYLRCDSVDQMKTWLTTLKKLVACLKLNVTGPLTPSLLDSMVLTDDARLLIHHQPSTSSPLLSRSATARHSILSQPTPSVSSGLATLHPLHTNSSIHSHRPLPSASTRRAPGYKRASTPVFSSPPSSSKRQSLAQIPDWEKSLPPQLPPPTSTPPPLPPTASHSNHPLSPVSEVDKLSLA